MRGKSVEACSLRCQDRRPVQLWTALVSIGSDICAIEETHREVSASSGDRDRLLGRVGRKVFVAAGDRDILLGRLGRTVSIAVSSPACCAHGNLYLKGGRGYEPRSTASPGEEEGATLDYISI